MPIILVSSVLPWFDLKLNKDNASRYLYPPFYTFGVDPINQQSER
jgi:hypothetical protein